jgi:hypothetical protein
MTTEELIQSRDDHIQRAEGYLAADVIGRVRRSGQAATAHAILAQVRQSQIDAEPATYEHGPTKEQEERWRDYSPSVFRGTGIVMREVDPEPEPPGPEGAR